MKKNIIITLAFGLFLFSCKNSNMRPEARAGKTPVTKNVTAEVLQPELACTSYSIFNPHGPLGSSVLYSYLDCSGNYQEGYVDPQETVTVLAQPGTVKCPGGVVTENGTVSPKEDPALSKQ